MAAPSFALFDMNDHALAVDIGDFESGAFGEPKSAGVDGQQTDSINWKADTFEDTPNFIPGEDNREPTFGLWSDEVEGRPLTAEGLGVEEFDAAD